MKKIFWLILPILAIIIALGGCYYYQSVPQEDNGENGDNETCGTCGVETNECGATEYDFPDFSGTPRSDETLCTDNADCEFHSLGGYDTCCIEDGTCMP